MHLINATEGKPMRLEKKAETRGRPKASRRLKRVTLTLNPDDWARFEEIGSDSAMATAALIRLAMREFLDRRRDGKTLAVKLGPRRAE
jgi:hypothetical protein